MSCQILVGRYQGPLQAVEGHPFKLVLSSQAGTYPKDGRESLTRRWSQSQCLPACFPGGPARSRFFAPAASRPLPFRSGAHELRAEGCPQEEKAGQKQCARDPLVPRFRGSLPKSKTVPQRPRIEASKRRDKE